MLAFDKCFLYCNSVADTYYFSIIRKLLTSNPIEIEKAFGKFQHAFQIKVLGNLGIN